MQNKRIAIMASEKSLQQKAMELSQRLHIDYITDSQDNEFSYVVAVTPLRIELIINTSKFLKPIYVDFLSKEMHFRRQHARVGKELLARAVGLTRQRQIKLLDVTAGLGRDAFLLAHFGCDVTMIERSPIIGILLEDGLQRAGALGGLNHLALQLVISDASKYLKQLNSDDFPDVIYLDPMFPEKTKSAKSKKEMQILRDIVGEDIDAAELLSLSLTIAKKRVVVKRPRLAQALNNIAPSFVYEGESNRFDVYLT